MVIFLLLPAVLDSLGEGTPEACRGLTNLPSSSPRLVESVSFFPGYTRRKKDPTHQVASYVHGTIQEVRIEVGEYTVQ